MALHVAGGVVYDVPVTVHRPSGLQMNTGTFMLLSLSMSEPPVEPPLAW